MIEIYNYNLSLLYILENFKSIKIREVWSDISQVEIALNLDKNILDYIKEDNLLSVDNKWFYIDTITIETEEEFEEIKVIGYSLINWLGRRVNTYIKNFSGPAEEIIRQLIDKNCITTDSNRIITNMMLGAKKGYAGNIQLQADYTNLLDTVLNIIKSKEWDIKIDVDLSTKKYICNINSSINKGINGTSLNPVMFCRELENILTTNFCESNATYKNACICVDNNTSPTITKTVGTSTGIKRYETYLNQKVDRTYMVTIEIWDEEEEDWVETEVEREYSEEYIKGVLEQKSKEYLQECIKVITFNCTVNSLLIDNCNLGDIITIVDEKIGLQVDRKITEIETIYDNTTKTVSFQFGADIPNFRKRIEKNI